ncbi:MAG: ATP-binding protein [Rhodoferax sp.]|jgi:two-component system OmpR family sensor kinase
MAEPSTEVARARITALEAELAAVRAEMQNFTYAVSHDLRAPLRHIVSYARLVQEDAGPQLTEEVQEFLTTITDSARHMGVMLDGLLALSRVGTVPVEMSVVSLQELVPAVCKELTAQYDQRNITWNIADDLPQVQADESLLRQALTQLIANAVKFTAPRQLAVIEIGCTGDAKSDCAMLQVKDNGVGYNPALQDHLFRVFGRLHSANQFAGIGVGLVMARKILERLGGTVSIEAAPDAGCRVQLQLKRV